MIKQQEGVFVRATQKEARRNKNKKGQLLSMASLIPLSACGGGGAAPAPTTPPPPNAAPTDITVSALTIAENTSGATVIGTVTTADADSTSHTYTVSDAQFEVVGGDLRLKAGNSLNFEAIRGVGSTATITMDITTTDGSGNTYTEAFTITITDVNDAPTTISLDVSSVRENDAGAVIGTLSSVDEDDVANAVTYSVSDTRFEVVGGQLKLKAGVSLDYEVDGSSVLVDVTVTDSAGLTTTEQLTITVEDVTELAPTDITVSALTIAENTSGATVIGTVTTADADSTSHTYTVSDARFEVVGGDLRLKAGNSLDFEAIRGAGSTATITMDITTTDGSSLSYTEAFTITVTDVNDAPTTISLDVSSVRENDAGAVIGTLSSVDEDDVANAVTYSVSDTRFEVVGGQLKLKAGVSLDYEVDGSSVLVDVTVTDSAGLTTTEQLTITVEDITELAGMKITGIDADDQSGFSVSNVGDVNGDGIDDIIIGAQWADPNALNLSGESYVIFGSSAGFPTSFDLSTLNGTNGFVLNGIAANDKSGWSVSSAGDVNGDGIGDILIGAPSALGYGFSITAGESYVIFGKNTGFAASFDISSLDGANGFIIGGLLDNDSFGAAVSSAGDINGDGFDDIIIGAYSADPAAKDTAGESYVIFGTDAAFGTYFDPSTLDGSNGFVISGIDPVDFSGYSVSGAGDVNGDGIDDVIIGAPNGDPSGNASAGETYVIFGSTTAFAANFDLTTLDGNNGFIINGGEADDGTGFSVSAAGDVNGDGIDDIIIGEPGGNATSNESYVVFGSDTGFSAALDLSSLDGSNGFVMHGITAGDRSGYQVSAAGDVNGDGFADIIVGAPATDTDTGESYVIFGTDQGFAASFTMSSLDGTNGFILRGTSTGDKSGITVSAAGDVNNDGFDDLIIGAPFADPGGVNAAGESYVIFGSDSSWQAVYDLSWIGKTILSSTSGNDAFVATDSADVFDFDATWGDDTVSGYQDGVDLLDMSDTGLVFGDLTIIQSGLDTLITDADGNSIILEGITSTDITADDFIF